jgi:hypothetical protein
VVAKRITFVFPVYLNQPCGGYKVHYQYVNALASQGQHLTVVLPVTTRGHPTWREVLSGMRDMARRPPITWFPFIQPSTSGWSRRLAHFSCFERT